MELMVIESKRDQSIYVEQILHGKFERISSTSLLLNTGASLAKLKAGSPVIGSVRIFAFKGAFFRGVKTMHHASI
jgi:hypothetical protein